MPSSAQYPQRAQLGVMSNNYFDFKKMRIEQANCAMKVSTDACIQGAWTPIEASWNKGLDIGTGTGLLSLMLAQRSDCLHIDALEIDTSAAQQAAINVHNSPFGPQINVHHTDARKWETNKLYDLIICNPPFFSKSLKGADDQRNLARHNDACSFNDLVKLIEKNLDNNGQASILLPCTELKRWEEAQEQSSLKIHQNLWIKPFAHSKANRVIQILGQSIREIDNKELVIYESAKQYTAAFTNLMHPFYLHL